MAHVPSNYDTRQRCATLHWIPVLNGVQNCTKESHHLRQRHATTLGHMLLWVLWGSVMFHLGKHRKATVAIFCLSNWRGRCLFQMLMGNKELPASQWFPLQPQNLWHEPWNAWNVGPTQLTLFKNSHVFVFVATTSATKVSFHGQKSTVWPLGVPPSDHCCANTSGGCREHRRSRQLCQQTTCTYDR